MHTLHTNICFNKGRKFTLKLYLLVNSVTEQYTPRYKRVQKLRMLSKQSNLLQHNSKIDILVSDTSNKGVDDEI